MNSLVFKVLAKDYPRNGHSAYIKSRMKKSLVESRVKSPLKHSDERTPLSSQGPAPFLRLYFAVNPAGHNLHFAVISIKDAVMPRECARSIDLGRLRRVLRKRKRKDGEVQSMERRGLKGDMDCRRSKSDVLNI